MVPVQLLPGLIALLLRVHLEIRRGHVDRVNYMCGQIGLIPVLANGIDVIVNMAIETWYNSHRFHPFRLDHPNMLDSILCPCIFLHLVFVCWASNRLLVSAPWLRI